jgi:hypothetical protein
MWKFGISMSALGAGAALFLGTASAQAASEFGSAVLVTGRDCGSKAANQACSGSGTTLFYQDYEGGVGQSVSISDSSPSGNAAASSITFRADALPVIQQSAAADANSRVNVNAFAFNSFTYTGDIATPLSYSADLHIVDSSGAPTAGNGNLANGAAYFAWVAIWNPSLVSSFLGPADAFNFGYGNYDCSTPGVLGFGGVSGSLSGGEQYLSMTTASCSGSPLMIDPGQEILAVAFLQTPVNRGGFVDASHTFRVSYDPSLSQDVLANLQNTMEPGVAGVPEPASWALMICGFGMAGVALRRRASLAA